MNIYNEHVHLLRLLNIFTDILAPPIDGQICVKYTSNIYIYIYIYIYQIFFSFSFHFAIEVILAPSWYDEAYLKTLPTMGDYVPMLMACITVLQTGNSTKVKIYIYIYINI